MSQKKKPQFKGIFALTVSILVASIILIDVLTTDFTNSNSVINITGHLRNINKNLPSRGSLNYDLFIQESPDVYKIGADDADCFDYDNFVNEISTGQRIKISFRKKNSLIKNSNLHFIVAIGASKKNYLDPECINKNLKNNKIAMPLLSLAIFGIGFLIYKFNR